ncbi:MAG TPA: 50S ribosomal protein L22 [Firmicutes bacterium]|nr:MAG: 50S ribosomal protein L22 [Candidatus Omnitrophota bacterium]HDD64917.1 50S ribosomal protein L22 [Bacillota bacterium]
MEAIAKARYVRIGPRKLRRIREIVIGNEVNKAIQTLQSLPQKGAKILVKVLKSALSNARQKAGEEKMWKVKNLIIDEGPKLKRYRIAAMGRAVMIRKRTSHITVILEDIEGEK